MTRRLKVAFAVVSMSCALTGVMSLLFYRQIRAPMMITGLVCAVVIDAVVSRVTLRYRAALRRANDELEERVAERTADLHRANSALASEAAERLALQEHLVASERMSAAGAMAAAISHEIRNPLMSITYNLEYVQNTETSGARPATIEALDAALEGVAQVRRIAVDLATLARPSVDGVEAVDVKATILLSSRLAAPHIRDVATLVIDVGEVPPVAASAPRLVQVFLNLITNAAQACAAGGQVQVTATHRGDVVSILVSDSGHGIPEDDLERVFEPFFTTKGASGGTGLGLSICRRIVEGCGGGLALVSAPGQGTTVTVELPVAEVLLDSSIGVD